MQRAINNPLYNKRYLIARLRQKERKSRVCFCSFWFSSSSSTSTSSMNHVHRLASNKNDIKLKSSATLLLKVLSRFCHNFLLFARMACQVSERERERLAYEDLKIARFVNFC